MSVENTSLINLVISFRGKKLTFQLPSTATLSDLTKDIEAKLSIPSSYQKFLVSPHIGLIKSSDSLDMIINTWVGKKITLLGSSLSEVSALNHAGCIPHRSAQRQFIKATPFKDFRKIQDQALYTFLELRPLDYLPDPAQSLAFLKRLCEDPGIQFTMRNHKFKVALLTEMNPIEHTTHESRTLGLNRNRGEIIELRLRTDAFDGYRDYKTIRKTLCHELAHNVYGEHDSNFWELCKQIEKEVEGADWRSNGRSVSNDVFYDPGSNSDQNNALEERLALTGGEFVLGTGDLDTRTDDFKSRRDILAAAAEDRMRKMKANSNPKPTPRNPQLPK
ncbi:MAG: hypothetical protein M1829_002579 [Trizodia sp. TS-e1964]|nr:MAG: hypothetical protein M1829_002579 [Trizodia sp. TS-e1964]